VKGFDGLRVALNGQVKRAATTRPDAISNIATSTLFIPAESTGKGVTHE